MFLDVLVIQVLVKHVNFQKFFPVSMDNQI